MPRIALLVAFFGAALILAACDRAADDTEDPAVAEVRADNAADVAVAAEDTPLASSGGEDAAIAVADDPPPEANPEGIGLAPFAGDWVVDAAACGSDNVYELRERLAFTPTDRCVLISGNTAPELDAEGADPARVEVEIYCERGREGVPPIGWPVPEPDRIDTWIVEAVGEASPATALRLDLGDGSPIDLVRCAG